MNILEHEINQRILIIDDNQSIHDDFKKVLCGNESVSSDLATMKADLFGGNKQESQTHHFNLDSSYIGQEGLDKVHQALEENHPYAMAFVDIRMPHGWDGIETVAHLWEEDPDLQIVICTAYSDYDWDEITKTLGKADGLLILKKPFDNIEVIQLAHALTTKWSLRQQTRSAMSSLEKLVADRTRELSIAKDKLEQEMRDREQIEVELRLAQKLESIGQLAAGIAHEINSPTQFVGDNTRFVQESFADIQAVIGQYDELVQSYRGGSLNDDLVKQVAAEIEKADLPYLMDEIPKAIEQSLEGVDRIAKIVGAMKEFSHPGTTEITNVEINHLIENTVTVTRNEWKHVADIAMQLNTKMPLVPCLPAEFSQVILNIIINAAHAIADTIDVNEKGKITIATSIVEDSVQIRITDTGAGIPEEIRDRIFDPFFTTKGVGRGTGQGLAIARSVVVEKLKGTICCKSQIGQGTEFIIGLPIHQHQGGD